MTIKWGIWDGSRACVRWLCLTFGEKQPCSLPRRRNWTHVYGWARPHCVLMWHGGVWGEQFVLICCLKIRASCSGSFPSNPPSNAINGPGQILHLVSAFSYINCSNQTDSLQFRAGENSHLHKELVAYVTRAQHANYEKPAHSFRCLMWTMGGRFRSSGLTDWGRPLFSQLNAPVPLFTPGALSFPPSG